MVKIILEKGKGKTTQLIKHSSKTGDYIICPSVRDAKLIQQQAMKMGLNIPFPLTYQEFKENRYYGKNISGFCIDDVEMFLQSFSYVPISAISMNPSKVIKRPEKQMTNYK